MIYISAQVNLSDILRLDAGEADTAAERSQLHILDILKLDSCLISFFNMIFLHVIFFLISIFFRCSEKLVDLVMMITNKLDTQVHASYLSPISPIMRYVEGKKSQTSQVAALRSEQAKQNEENAKR